MLTAGLWLKPAAASCGPHDSSFMFTITRRAFLEVGSATIVGAMSLGAAQAPTRVRKENLAAVKALTFDTFGTVVDYRTSIIAECEALGRAKNLHVDWAAFTDAWRGMYVPTMNRVRS